MYEISGRQAESLQGSDHHYDIKPGIETSDKVMLRLLLKVKL
jgi:hypothetical protein